MKKKSLCKIALGFFVFLILAITAGMTVGCGGAIRKNSAVEQERAFAKLQLVKVGDFVIMEDGRPHAVVAKYKDVIHLRTLYGERSIHQIGSLARRARGIATCCNGAHSEVSRDFIMNVPVSSAFLLKPTHRKREVSTSP